MPRRDPQRLCLGPLPLLEEALPLQLSLVLKGSAASGPSFPSCPPEGRQGFLGGLNPQSMAQAALLPFLHSPWNAPSLEQGKAGKAAQQSDNYQTFSYMF